MAIKRDDQQAQKKKIVLEPNRDYGQNALPTPPARPYPSTIPIAPPDNGRPVDSRPLKPLTRETAERKELETQRRLVSQADMAAARARAEAALRARQVLKRRREMAMKEAKLGDWMPLYQETQRDSVSDLAAEKVYVHRAGELKELQQKVFESQVEAGLAELERTRKFFDTSVPSYRRYYDYAQSGGEGTPDMAVISNPAVFDVNNPEMVKYVQRWLISEHNMTWVTVNGDFDWATANALIWAADREEEKALVDEATFIRDELIPKSSTLAAYMKANGLTIEQVARGVMGSSGVPPSPELIAAYEQSWQEFATFEDRSAALPRRDAQGNLMTGWQGPMFGFVQPSELDLLETLPNPLTRADMLGEQFDQAMLRQEVGARLRSQQYASQKAGQEMGFWDRNFPFFKWLFGKIIWPGEQVARAAYSSWVGTRNVNDMMNEGRGFGEKMDISPTEQYRAFGEEFAAAWDDYPRWREEHPWYNFALSAVLDPLNFVGVGVIGNTAKFLRYGTRIYKIEETATGLLGVVKAADRMLSRLEQVRRARDIIIPMGRNAGSFIHDTLRAVGKIDPSVAKVTDRIIDYGQAATQGVSKAKMAVGDAWDVLVKRNFGVRFVAGSGDALARQGGEEVERIFKALPKRRADEIASWYVASTFRLATAIAKGMPKLVSRMDEFGSRLFFDESTRTTTQFGARLEAQMSEECFEIAKQAMVADGRASWDMFADSHLVIQDANIQADFNNYLKVYQDLMGQVVLPTLDTMAQKAGYGFELSPELAAKADELLGAALSETHEVWNPCWRFVADFPDDASRLAYRERLYRQRGIRRGTESIERELSLVDAERAARESGAYVPVSPHWYKSNSDILTEAKEAKKTLEELDVAIDALSKKAAPILDEWYKRQAQVAAGGLTRDTEILGRRGLWDKKDAAIFNELAKSQKSAAELGEKVAKIEAELAEMEAELAARRAVGVAGGVSSLDPVRVGPYSRIGDDALERAAASRRKSVPKLRRALDFYERQVDLLEFERDIRVSLPNGGTWDDFAKANPYWHIGDKKLDKYVQARFGDLDRMSVQMSDARREIGEYIEEAARRAELPIDYDELARQRPFLGIEGTVLERYSKRLSMDKKWSEAEAGAIALGDEDGFAALKARWAIVDAKVKQATYGNVPKKVWDERREILDELGPYLFHSKSSIETPREAWATREVRMGLISEQTIETQRSIRSLDRAIRGVSRGMDEELFEKLAPQMLKTLKARLAKWRQIASDLGARGVSVEARRTAHQVDEHIDHIESQIRFWSGEEDEVPRLGRRELEEIIAEYSMDDDAGRRFALGQQEDEVLAELDELYPGLLQSVLRKREELALARAQFSAEQKLQKMMERLQEKLDDFKSLRLEYDELTAGGQARAAYGWRSAGPKVYSSKAVAASIEEEQRMWTRRYREYDKRQAARGIQSDSTAALSKKLVEIEQSWKEVGPGAYVNTRKTIEVPDFYGHGFRGSDEWISAGLGLPAGVREEVRSILTGYDPFALKDKGLSYGVVADEGALRHVAELEEEAAAATTRLSEAELAGLDDATRTQLMTQKMQADANLATGRKSEIQYRLRGGAGRMSDDIGYTLPDFIRRGREAERSVYGHVGADDAVHNEVVSALRERVAINERAERVLRPYLYKSQLMYMRALEYSNYRPIRIAYRTVQGATTVWKFAALPLRLGWVVRNVLDNFVKCFLAGLRDPRYFIVGTTNAFALGRVNVLRGACALLDKMTGTSSLRGLDTILGHVFDVREGYLARLFGLENIPIPAEVSRGTFAKFFLGNDPSKGNMVGAFWAMMGSGPEEMFRKALYRDVYAKSLRSGATIEEAMETAIETVNRHLFDYSDVTVIEDNLKLIFPFLQFWRKNAVLWPELVMDHPWFMADLSRWNSTLDAINKDKPAWMRRYLSLDPVGDWLAGVLGWDWLATAFKDAAFDPLDMFSFAPLYRAFKLGNPTLTDSEGGFKFLATFLDAFDKYGLGMNPLFRKPLEIFGVITPELWRSAFPQTSLVRAFTMEFLGDLCPDGFDIEAWITDPIFEALGRESVSEFQQRTFEDWVQLEISRQVERGEEPDLEAAQAKIRRYIAVQSVVGYFSGVYTRQMSPEDIALALALQEGLEGNWKDPTIWERHPGLKPYLRYLRQKNDPEGFEGPADAAAFAQWAEVDGLLSAYKRVPYDKREAFLKEHPELRAYVTSSWHVAHPKSKFVQYEQLSHNTDIVIKLSQTLDVIEKSLTYEQKQEILDYFRTPEMEAFWAKNDTMMDKAMAWAKAQMFVFYDQLNKAFFSIPADDYESQDAFLKENPALQMFWTYWNRDDDGKTATRIFKTACASLREVWGAMMDAKLLGAAEDFLKDHPFMFEGTSAQDNVTIDGDWIPKKMRDSENIEVREMWRAWASSHPYEASQALFWNKFLSLSSDSRWDFVREFGAQYGFEPYTQGWGAQLHEDALARIRQRAGEWGDEHAEAYRSVEPLLMRYFGLPAGPMREQYLSDHPMLAEYLRRWGKQRSGSTARGRAYRAVKHLLDEYFKLTDPVEKILFRELHPEVTAYFRKWGRKLSDDPVLNDLAAQYFALPAFSSARREFLKEHPELSLYFDQASLDPETRAIHALLEVYFSLPKGARDDFLSAHPELEYWFDERDRTKARLRERRMEEDMKKPWLRAVYEEFAATYLGQTERVRSMLGRKTGEVEFSRESSFRGRVFGQSAS